MNSRELKFVETVGLNAVTIHDGSPHFFLFADIDGFDTEVLRLVLQKFATWRLSFYWFSTTKGYHVISPVLLDIRQWTRYRLALKEYCRDYAFDTIRWSTRYSDGRVLHFEDFNYDREIESLSLHKRIMQRFGELNVYKPWYRETKLDWSIYYQARLRENATGAQPSGTSGFKCPPSDLDTKSSIYPRVHRSLEE